ncbi:MAG: YigZ family protein [Lachnospiraceae bacterium]|nr:YigZ family protein [Lachnospiraceae bacterium]
MCENIRTVYKGGEGEYEEKKSRFIAHVTPVKDADEAAAFINSIKKQYWDARHNCSAFIVGERGELTRSSDDGEPSGTAGKPMLELLKSERLTGVCVVVTRYFGGVLLGTGGLIRAYTAAVKAGLENCVIMEKRRGTVLTVRGDYSSEGLIRRFFKDNELPLTLCTYSDVVSMETIVDSHMVDEVIKKLTELSAGALSTQAGDELEYALAGDEVILF